MANVCKNTITVIGLKEAPERFINSLSKEMLGLDLDNLDPKLWGEDPNVDGRNWYSSLVKEFRQEGVYASRFGVLYTIERYERLGLTAPRFYVETKWKPAVDGIAKASKAFPELRFHLAWWILQDGPAGEIVMGNGEVVEEVQRLGSWYLFDWRLCYPTISLLPAHLPFTLAQRGALRVEDAIRAIEDLRGILDDDRFKISPHTPFSECRDREKTEKLQAGLAALHEFMVEQAKQLDFTGVFLETHELKEELPRMLEADKALMQGLGLKHVVPAPGETVRFSILPFKVAAISDPCRAILPVVRYLNANSATGKYVKLPNGSFPSIDSEIGYVCLTRRDIVEIRRLPNENQKPYDIDLTMTHAGDRGFGYELACASSQARWILNPETARVVQQKAIEMSAALVAKLTDRPGITLFDDLEATESVARKAKQ